jgi:hypothetical protein
MNKQEEWKITKFWDTIMLDNGEYGEGWNYEAGYHIGDDVIYEDYFETRKEAELYIEKMKKEMNK